MEGSGAGAEQITMEFGSGLKSSGSGADSGPDRRTLIVHTGSYHNIGHGVPTGHTGTNFLRLTE